MEFLSIMLAVVFLIVSVPILIWRIPPNWCYGVRCSKTLAPGNEEIWYKVNRFAAKVLIACSIIMFFASFLFYSYKASFTPALYWSLGMAISVIPLVAVLVIIAIYVKKA